MAALLLTAILQDEWKLTVQRTAAEGVRNLDLAGAERLPDGCIISVSARLRREFRRTPDDVPGPIDGLLRQFERPIAARTERARVMSGAWKHSMAFTEWGLAPGCYELGLEFDPTAQPPAVIGMLPKDVKPIQRAASIVLAAPREEKQWAEEVERMHGVLTRIAKAFERVEEAAKKDRVTRSIVGRALQSIQEQMTLLEPHSETSIVARTIWQLFEINDQIMRANQHMSGPEKTDTDPPAQIGDAALSAFRNARLMFSAEVYLFMRTMLAELRDRTWEAYSAALAQERPAAWNAWKPAFSSVRKALGQAHERMAGYEEAEFYKQRGGADADPKTSIPAALEALDKLAEACERRLNDPKADPPDALWEALKANLPPPPEKP